MVTSACRKLSDPWVRSAWRYLRGTAMVLSARYDEARTCLQETLANSDEFGLRVRNAARRVDVGGG